jgi:hypothetical protein
LLLWLLLPQAIAKIAVRSGEPFRVQAYSLLTATRASSSSTSNRSSSALSGGGQGSAGVQRLVAGLPQVADPLGVAAAVGPALEVLDAMYAGELLFCMVTAVFVGGVVSTDRYPVGQQCVLLARLVVLLSLGSLLGIPPGCVPCLFDNPLAAACLFRLSFRRGGGGGADCQVWQEPQEVAQEAPQNAHHPQRGAVRCGV